MRLEVAPFADTLVSGVIKTTSELVKGPCQPRLIVRWADYNDALCNTMVQYSNVRRRLMSKAIGSSTVDICIYATEQFIALFTGLLKREHNHHQDDHICLM